jgi:hypothetical protein
VEDDHVDRPGVEERQRLKLTGTNSSIGLIVLIPYAHRETRWSDQRSRMSGPYGPMLREGAGNRRRAVALAGLRPKATNVALAQKTASRTTCVLPTWWLWRSGCTRSHSELGRETLQR